jgi:hypothetical protein
MQLSYFTRRPPDGQTRPGDSLRVVTKSDNGSPVLTQIQFQDKTLVFNSTDIAAAGR